SAKRGRTQHVSSARTRLPCLSKPTLSGTSVALRHSSGDLFEPNGLSLPEKTGVRPTHCSMTRARPERRARRVQSTARGGANMRLNRGGFLSAFTLRIPFEACKHNKDYERSNSSVTTSGQGVSDGERAEAEQSESTKSTAAHESGRPAEDQTASADKP